MGFAIIKKDGKVSWMQTGNTAPKLRDPSTEKLFRVPDRLVIESQKMRTVEPKKVAGAPKTRVVENYLEPPVEVTYFEVDTATIYEIGINAEARLEEFMAELLKSELFDKTEAPEIKLYLSAQLAFSTGNCQALKTEFLAYLASVTDPDKATLRAIAKKCNLKLENQQDD